MPECAQSATFYPEDGVDAYVAEALESARANHDSWVAASIYWERARTESKKPDGDREQVMADYATAAESFREMAARPLEARVLRDWGEELQRVGQPAEAAVKLDAALAAFDELGLTREADALRASLA